MISHTEGRFVSPPSPLNVKYIQNVWQMRNWCRISLIRLVGCSRRHLSSVHLIVISLSSPCGYCGWKKSPVVKCLSGLFKVVVSLGFVSCAISEVWLPLYSLHSLLNTSHSTKRNWGARVGGQTSSAVDSVDVSEEVGCGMFVLSLIS